MQVRRHDRCHVFLNEEYDCRVRKVVLPAYLNMVKFDQAYGDEWVRWMREFCSMER